MEIQNVFNNFLCTDILDIDNNELVKYSYQEKEKSTGRIRSNRGGWQSNDLDLSDPNIQPLVNAITEKLNSLHLNLGFSEKYKQFIDNMWININPPGSLNLMHYHENSFFSGSYYVSTNAKTGSIHFVNPIPVHDWVISKEIIKDFNSFNSKAWEILPKSNLLVIFPAWLEHFVNENKSDVDRISISFNTKLSLR
jgi:hypothetical protein